MRRKEFKTIDKAGAESADDSGKIVGMNGIKDPNNVPVGTELKIPQK